MFWSVQENSIEEEQCLNDEQRSIMDDSGAVESDKFEGHGISFQFIMYFVLKKYKINNIKYYEYNVLSITYI